MIRDVVELTTWEDLVDVNETITNKVKEYVKTIYLKDFFIKLFMKMLDYNIDSKLLSLMKELIIKQDFDYFDKYLMPYFISLNP